MSSLTLFVNTICAPFLTRVHQAFAVSAYQKSKPLILGFKSLWNQRNPRCQAPTTLTHLWGKGDQYPFFRAMFSPLSTEYPKAGGLIFNSIASSPSDMPYPFTARYHKLFSFIYVTYFFTRVPNSIKFFDVHLSTDEFTKLLNHRKMSPSPWRYPLQPSIKSQAKT